MFPTMMMNPWNNFSQNEHAKLIENYQNVSLQVKYLQEIIKNLEEKIHELENEKEAKKSNVKTCKLRHPRECRYFNSDRSCFHGESCAYLHKENCPLNENSANEETESNTAKLVTIEVNGKKFTVEKIEELDDETTNAMTADDF